MAYLKAVTSGAGLGSDRRNPLKDDVSDEWRRLRKRSQESVEKMVSFFYSWYLEMHDK